ncbi:MAG: hypothetical protein ACYDA0_08605 [Candidatus Dormibacteraceae bacterium]
MPRNNLFKIGVATAAAAVGAILAITSVFAHSTPSTNGQSLVGNIVNAAQADSFPVFTNEPAPNTLTDEQALDAEQAAELAAQQQELAAELAAQQQELAAELAAQQQELAAELAAEKADQGTDADQESANVTMPTSSENHDTSSDH